MDLTRHYEEFRDALVHAFSSEELEMLVRLDLGERLEHIVGAGTVPKKAFDLIDWADRQGRADELFAAALKRRPNNPRIGAFAAHLAKESAQEQERLIAEIQPLDNQKFENPQADQIRARLAARPSASRLEALIAKVPNLRTGQAVDDWRAKMRDAETRVCSIALNATHRGTGFLISRDRIITNSHVIDADHSLESYDAVFDYVSGTFREELPKLRIAQELARSQPREYDYTICRLEVAPEGDRGYFKVTEHRFDTIREPVSILGHPNGDPLSLSFGVVFDNDSFMGRVAYNANTAPGSSGSPVFTESWDLVAIHHHGEANVNNHGIPILAIAKHLKDNGNEALIDVQ